MAINFPDSPSSGDIYTVNGKKWQWDGTTWNVITAVGSTNSLSDTDSDTKIVLEKTSDEDIIRFDVAGTEQVYISSSEIMATPNIVAKGDLNVTGTITGDVTGNLTGNVTGDVTGDLTGNVNGGTLKGTLKSPYELWNIVAGAPGTGASHPVDLLTATAWYYTSNNTGHFELNFRGDSSTTLDSLMSVGEAVTTSVLVTNGATPYYNTNTLVDGTSVTVEWQNAAGPSAGNASQIDTYTFTIIKTASATFSVLGSFTTFG